MRINSCELRLAQGEVHMFLAIDRVTKFVYAAFFGAATKLNGAQFLREVVAGVPLRHPDGADRQRRCVCRTAAYHGGMSDSCGGGHISERVCRQHDIDHRLTKPYHAWANGQAERMNRTVKEASIKAFHYPDLEDLKAHVLALVTAYHFAKHLKPLRWRKPFQAVCDAWAEEPSRFNVDPHHLAPGPNTQPKKRTH